MRWTDSVKEATGMSAQQQSRAGEDRTLWTSLIHRVGHQGWELAQQHVTHTPTSWWGSRGKWTEI